MPACVHYCNLLIRPVCVKPSEAVSAIRISILYQEVPSERAMTKDFLFGGSKTKKVLVFGCGQMRALGHHPTPEHVI